MEVKPGYKRTEVGVIPEEWEVWPVGRMGEVVTGKALAVNGPGKQRPYLRTKNVFDGRIDIGDVLTMPMTDDQFIQFGLHHGDVLLNEGQSLELVGRCAIYQGEYPEPCAIQNQLIRFRARDGVSGIFASYVFRHCQQSGVFTRIALQTTSVAHLGASRFRRLRLAWPKSEIEQRAIAEALSDVDGLLGGLDQLIAKKVDLKQAAVQQLLTGQTRLPGFHGKWNLKRFGELLKYERPDKFLVNSAEYLEKGDIPVLTANKSFILGFTNDEFGVYQNLPAIIFDDFTTASRYIDFPFKVKSSAIKILKARSKDVNLQFIFARMQLVDFPLGEHKRYYISEYQHIELPTPEPDEQTAIAEVLTAMDTELAALELRREKTCALKQAMMQELLTGNIRLVSAATNVAPLHQKRKAVKAKPTHNWQINEAVVISVLTKYFGSEQFPLGRKRYTKFSYLLHRHFEKQAQGYLKKAAGPYNPALKYKGPEGIALKNSYVRCHTRDKFRGFVASDKIAEAENYFAQWYGKEVLTWLEQFRRKTNDDLELLTTVDMAMEDLSLQSRTVDLKAVKEVIDSNPEWEAKLSRPIFSDANIKRTIGLCKKLFGS